jgi:hypothetical protein
VQRLDSVGHELGTARDRGETQVIRDKWERAEQLLDVRLNARARSSPRATSSSRCHVARSIPAAIAAGSSGSTSTAAPSATSSVAPPRLVTTGVPQAIASSTGIPKPS